MNSYNRGYNNRRRFEDTSNENPDQQAVVNAIEKLKKALSDSEEKNLRLRAEMENQKKRYEKEIADSRETAAFNFVSELLPVKDSLEKGLDVTYMEDGHIQAEELFEGMSSTLKIFNDTLKKEGIEELNPIGKTFNPDIHEAMSVKKVQDVLPNKVLAVFQKGYMIDSRLIRPARVEVSVS